MTRACTVSSFWPQKRIVRLFVYSVSISFLAFNGIYLHHVAFGPSHLKDSLAGSNVTLHIAFVKTHKAASSTVLNILYRFARGRDLVVILPKIDNYLRGAYLNKSSMLPPPKGKIFDILCNHAIFNYTSFSTFLPPDTTYIGAVREPFERFLSAFFYFRFGQGSWYLRRIPAKRDSGLTKYFKYPERWEPRNPMLSMTNNRMAVDFGFPVENFNNESLFDEYLLNLNRTFRIVIVTELFDESLVLMKRFFNWTVKDILYTVKNKARHKTRRPLISEDMKSKFRTISKLDYKLYTFFWKRLQSQIELEGQLFRAEVKYFKAVRDTVARFCERPGQRRILRINASNWTKGFNVTRIDCGFLKMEEMDFVDYVRRQQKIALQHQGANIGFMRKLPD